MLSIGYCYHFWSEQTRSHYAASTVHVFFLVKVCEKHLCLKKQFVFEFTSLAVGQLFDSHITTLMLFFVVITNWGLQIRKQ